MTEESKAKEKAEKLVLSFIHVDDRAMKKGSQSAWIDQILAKRCAIICCDKIIKELEKLHKPEYATFILRYIKYKKGTTEMEHKEETCDGYELIRCWQKVKEIINK